MLRLNPRWIDRALPHRLRIHDLDRPLRLGYLGVQVVIALGMVVLAVPVDTLARAGVITDAEGGVVISTVAFYVGCGALGLCVMTAAASLRFRAARLGDAADNLGDHGSVRVGSVLLGLTSVAWFGAPYRQVLQLAGAHNFFLHDGASSAVRYWGWTLVVVTTIAFAAPLGVVAANFWPRLFTLRRLRSPLVATSARRWVFVLPVVAAAVVVLVTQVTPPHVRAGLGYTAPGDDTLRATFDVRFLGLSVWYSFARLAFLVLAVGMWEGAETARACRVLSSRWVSRVALPPEGPAVQIVGWCAFVGAVGYAAFRGEWWLIATGLALAVLISAAMAGAPLVAIRSLRSIGTRLQMSDEVRVVAPIGLVLLVVAGPVLQPLVMDLWRGLEGPFRLPVDAMGYVHYWGSYGIAHVPEVSIDGIFGHGARIIAIGAAGVVSLLVLSTILNKWDREDTGPAFSIAIRVGLIAAILVPVINAAERSSTPFVVSACALPVILFSERIADVPAPKFEYVVAVVLLGIWAVIVWHYTWLPAYGVLAATIVWKFFLHAREFNKMDVDERVERGALNLSIACLGVALLALDHGTREGVLSSIDVVDVTDRIGVAVVAPIMLIALTVHRAVTAVKERTAE